jgi:hypothetical protein
MYTYKLKDPLFYDQDKVFFLDDDMVFIDPLDFFGSENIEWWNHQNDQTFEIDLDSCVLFASQSKDFDFLNDFIQKTEKSLNHMKL